MHNCFVSSESSLTMLKQISCGSVSVSVAFTDFTYSLSCVGLILF